MEWMNTKTGEMIPHEADDRDTDGPTPDELAEAFDAAARRIKGQPMSHETVRALMDTQQPIPVGIMGWAAKVGRVTNPKTGKTTPGMRLTGQIVSTFAARGKWGRQQVIVVSGIYSCPAHINGQNQQINAVREERGRRVFACDASTIDLPNHVGDIVDLEIDTTGGRHTYKKIDIYPADGSGPKRPPKDAPTETAAQESAT